MPRREVLKYLLDIQTAIDALASFTQNQSYRDYVANRMLRSAVERQFEIVGEALNQLLKIDPGLGASISGHRRIIGFRNRLIHGYSDVNDETVWSIVETMLPILRTEIADLIGTGIAE